MTDMEKLPVSRSSQFYKLRANYEEKEEEKTQQRKKNPHVCEYAHEVLLHSMLLVHDLSDTVSLHFIL